MQTNKRSMKAALLSLQRSGTPLSLAVLIFFPMITSCASNTCFHLYSFLSYNPFYLGMFCLFPMSLPGLLLLCFLDSTLTCCTCVSFEYNYMSAPFSLPWFSSTSCAFSTITPPPKVNKTLMTGFYRVYRKNTLLFILRRCS